MPVQHPQPTARHAACGEANSQQSECNMGFFLLEAGLRSCFSGVFCTGTKRHLKVLVGLEADPLRRNRSS